MASDITLAVGDDSRRMTYAELAETTRDPAIRGLEHAIEGLCEQLENANQRADRAAQRGDLRCLSWRMVSVIFSQFIKQYQRYIVISIG